MSILLDFCVVLCYKSPMTDLLDDILNNITPDRVAAARPKAAKGRPKGIKRVNAERTKAEKDFIDGYEPKVPYRPEPQRLIRALALPEDQHQKALEDALLPRQLAFCKEYVIDFKQREAAIRAGYSAKTAEGISHNLMAYRGITRLI